MAMAPDSPYLHHSHYNIMIITVAVLAVDWAILTLNDYTLLSYHSVYISWLVVRLWARKQP